MITTRPSQRITRRAWQHRRCGWFVGVALTLLGCVGDKGVAPSLRDPSQSLNWITASPLNVIMAVGDTLSVSIAGYAADGSPVTGFDSVQYKLNNIVDTLRVSLSPTGVVTGRAASGSSTVLLNVYAFKDDAAAVDQVVILVTDTKFSGATLSIHPTGSDSARLAIGSTKTITPIVMNPSTNTRVANTRFRLSTSPEESKIVGCYVPSIPSSSAPFQFVSAALVRNGCAASFGLNQIKGMARGTAWIHADALVYGTMLHDSVQYTITNIFEAFSGVRQNNLEIFCSACTAVIAPGGTVTFQNSLSAGLGTSVTFTFEDPSVALAASSPSSVGGSSGNVTALNAGQSSTRRFVTPGTYPWTETVTGAPPPFANGTYQGQVVVQ